MTRVIGRTAMLLVMAAAVTAPVAAQLRMPKIKNPLAKVTGPDPDAPRTGAVTFDDDVLEITAARLGALGNGLQAEQAMAARVDAQDLAAIARADSIADARYQRDMAAYDAARSRHDACVQQQLGGPAAQAQAAAPSASDLQRLEAVAERVRAAQARGDMAEVMRLSDSLAKVGTRAGTTANAIAADAQRTVQSACGPAPTAPTAASRSAALSYTDIVQAGQRASGLTARQYRILRERVAPVILGVRPGGLVYTQQELDAIAASRSNLDQYRDLMRRF